MDTAPIATLKMRAAKRRLTRTTFAVLWIVRLRLATAKNRIARDDSEYVSLNVPKDSDKKPSRHASLWEQCWLALASSQINYLLIALPLSLIAYYLGWGATWVFMLSCVALCPLASQLGDLTEDLSLRYNETVGALLNASFGNATELIVSIFALKAGLYDVIKYSLVGSVLGNMMLVLGTAFLAAGLRHRNLHHSFYFNVKASETYCALLLLASMGMLIPTVMFTEVPSNVLYTSRCVSILMITCYVLYVIFQMYTHKSMFEAGQGLPEIRSQPDVMYDDYCDDEDDPDEPSYSAAFAIASLCLCTILIAFESELLVDALEPAAHAWGLSNAFISVILLPIVGNAAEHATAITTAYKGKVDIALGVAVGSSIQISLFVVPLLVTISWCLGKTLDLAFEPFILTLMVMSVIITKSIVEGGSSTWLSGAMLLLAYGMIGVALFNSPNE